MINSEQGWKHFPARSRAAVEHRLSTQQNSSVAHAYLHSSLDRYAGKPIYASYKFCRITKPIPVHWAGIWLIRAPSIGHGLVDIIIHLASRAKSSTKP